MSRFPSSWKNPDSIETGIVSRMTGLHIPGCEVTIVNGGAVAASYAEGSTAAKSGHPVGPSTIFQAASISKPVTAMAAMVLVQQGRLSLDEDVNLKLRSWHLPKSPAANGKPVTLRRLLSHSGGTTGRGFPGYPEGTPIPTLPQLLDGKPPANSRAVRVDIEPGTLSRYSGGGYAIVQMLMIDVTRKSFDRIMHELILGPLGMSRSSYTQPLPDRLRQDAALAHQGNGSAYAWPWTNHPEMSAAGLWTTTNDLALVILEMQAAANGGGKVLSAKTAAEMLKVQKGNMGLGWGIAGTGRGLRFSHGGTNRGYRGQLTATVKTGQGVVILTNSDAGHALTAEVVQVVSSEYSWPSLSGEGSSTLTSPAAPSPSPSPSPATTTAPSSSDEEDESMAPTCPSSDTKPEKPSFGWPSILAAGSAVGLFVWYCATRKR